MPAAVRRACTPGRDDRAPRASTQVRSSPYFITALTACPACVLRRPSLRSPNQTSPELEAPIVDARERLASNPRAQFGALAIQRELTFASAGAIGFGCVVPCVRSQGCDACRRRCRSAASVSTVLFPQSTVPVQTINSPGQTNPSGPS